MLNLKNLFNSGACMLLVAVVMPFTIANAAASDLRVNLIATIDNGPAMEDVTWRVLRNGNEEVKRANKHSTHVYMEPGKYTAIARLTSNDKVIIRKRNFMLTRNNTMVVIPMDE